MEKQPDLINSDLLFVYGTLIPGTKSPLKAYVEKWCEVVGDAWIMGTLTKINSYPALIVDEHSGKRIKGVLLRLKDLQENLKILDDYEGIGPQYPRPWEYLRELHLVNHASGVVKAWVYVLNPEFGV